MQHPNPTSSIRSFAIAMKGECQLIHHHLNKGGEIDPKARAAMLMTRVYIDNFLAGRNPEPAEVYDQYSEVA